MKLSTIGMASLLVSALCVFRGSSLGQTITWSGAGDGASWFDTNNWAGGLLPGPGNDVVITGGAGTNVIIWSPYTIRSIQCSKALSIATTNSSTGSLQVSAGSSTISGLLTMASGTSLSASGPGATLECSGAANILDANFSVSAGATLAVDNLQQYVKSCSGANWTVSGAGSTLSFPALTNFTGAACSYPTIQALAGGQILMSNVTSLTVSPLAFVSDGANSLIDMAALTSAPGESGYPVQFTASNGGRINIPNFTGSPVAQVTVTSGSSMPLAQFGQLYSLQLLGVSSNMNNLTNVEYLVVSNTVMSFAGLSNFYDGSVTAEGGASVSFPTLVSYGKHCNGLNWTATGSNTVLSMTALTNIIGDACNYPNIMATQGGTILLSNVLNIAEGPLTISADRSNSLVDLSSLQTAAGAQGYLLSLVPSNGGTIKCPQFGGGPLVAVTVNPNATINTAKFTQLDTLVLDGTTANLNALVTLVNLTVSGVTMSFPALTNFYDGNVSLTSGAVVTFPNLRTYSKNCSGANWTVTGAGSVFSLPLVTNIIGNPCNYPNIQALAGGQILIPSVQTIVAGPLYFLADGANSLVDLSGLKSAAGQSPYFVTFTASNGGYMKVPQLTGGPFVGVTVNGSGTLPVSQMTQLGSLSLYTNAGPFTLLTNVGSITAVGCSNSFPALTNFDDGNFTLSGGAFVSLPNLQSYAKNCNGANWTVTDPSSILSLPELTNIVGQVCQFPVIQAEAGGQILMTNLLTASGGPLAFQADGANSLIDMSHLVGATGNASYEVTFESSASGSLNFPRFIGGPYVTLIFNSGWSMPVSQIGTLGGITDNGQTVTLAGLTNFNNGMTDINGGGVLSAPNLLSYQHTDCNVRTVLVTDAGSVLNFGAITSLAGDNCNYQNFNAENGGLLVLSNTASIGGGYFAVLADGTGSVVDLHNMSGFVVGSGQGSLTAQNSGVILLSSQAFILANVAISIPPGNPILPPTLINATNLSLYGLAGHSYLVQQRSATNPTGPWLFYQYVPLTNTFQAISATVPANINFLVTEFRAEPAFLGLTLQPGYQHQIVLYGITNKTYQIQSTTNLATTNWILTDVTLSNFFFIQPPATDYPAQFFHVKEF